MNKPKEEPPTYPTVEPDGDGYIIRLDDLDNWHFLTAGEARMLRSALLAEVSRD